ncbi:MAG: hypothetical protein ACREUX_18390 [Burkholderiales bacterium]
MARALVRRIGSKSVAVLRSAQELTAREKRHLLNEILQVRGLMPLLMKQRNKGRWSAEDRAELRVHLRRLSNLSPYLIVVALPGSFILLPALAWWLDRRRMRGQRRQGVETKV